jgi:hypothetical protein
MTEKVAKICIFNVQIRVLKLGGGSCRSDIERAWRQRLGLVVTGGMATVAPPGLLVGPERAGAKE